MPDKSKSIFPKLHRLRPDEPYNRDVMIPDYFHEGMTERMFVAAHVFGGLVAKYGAQADMFKGQAIMLADALIAELEK